MTTLLQIQETIITTQATDISMISLIIKGGWIMVPLFILAILAIFFISDSWFSVKKMMNVNSKWFGALLKTVGENDLDKALAMTKKNGSALSRVVKAGLMSSHLPKEQIEEDMQVAARQVLARAESPVSYLSMIAAIAPMLGFLGTIFGVIKIFINISLTNDLSISSISDGLYQKMICSGVGLLIGIIAYTGYYILNRRVDKIVLTMDQGGNEFLKVFLYGREQKK